LSRSPSSRPPSSGPVVPPRRRAVVHRPSPGPRRLQTPCLRFVGPAQFQRLRAVTAQETAQPASAVSKQTDGAEEAHGPADAYLDRRDRRRKPPAPAPADCARPLRPCVRRRRALAGFPERSAVDGASRGEPVISPLCPLPSSLAHRCLPESETHASCSIKSLIRDSGSTLINLAPCCRPTRPAPVEGW
jgi:hypothetical protein